MPGDGSSHQDFVVGDVEANALPGTSYRSEVEDARITSDRGRSISPAPSPPPIPRGEGVFDASGVQAGDRLEGTTHSLRRKFLDVRAAGRKND